MSDYTSLQERVEMLQRADNGEPISKIARELGWHPSTIKKWVRRGREQGRQGLARKMGRPQKGALSSYPARMVGELRQMRLQHPRWGADTLRIELGHMPQWAGKLLPSRSSINRLLQEEQLVQNYERHVALPSTKHTRLTHAHKCWQVDAMGHEFIPDVGIISLVDVSDIVSRTRLLSYPCFLGEKKAIRHANTEDYQITLRLAFLDWGLPESIQVDHDSVFFDVRSKSPFPTRLHLWLLAMGIELQFSRIRRPTDQAIVERSHQLWADQVLDRHYRSWNDLYQALRDRRSILNEELPCHSLGGQAPLQAFPEAAHSGRWYRPEWEDEMFDPSQVDAYLAKGKWFRRIGQNGTISLGGQIYYLGKDHLGEQCEINFKLPERVLLFLNQRGELIKRLPIQGIDPPTLIGDIFAFTQSIPFQPSLPFTWQEQQRLRLFET